MEYISAEEFLKQHKEVQEVFLNWWKESTGDLYSTVSNYGAIGVLNGSEIKTKDMFPLFTEGQLRKFIEDKTGCKIDINNDPQRISIELLKKDCGSLLDNDYKFTQKYLGTDLLQAYWKVACEIAKEVIN